MEETPADDWSDWTPEPAAAQEFEDWSDVAAAVPAAVSWDTPAPAAGAWDEGAPEPALVPAAAGTALVDPFTEPAPKPRRRRFNLPADEDPFG